MNRASQLQAPETDDKAIPSNIGLFQIHETDQHITSAPNKHEGHEERPGNPGSDSVVAKERLL